MPTNVFAESLPSYVKKALGNLKVEGPAAQAIATACATMRRKSREFEYNSPGLVGDSAIHFTFPNLKLGLLLKAKENTGQVFKHKVLKCRKLGWNVMIVTTEDIEVLAQNIVTDHLKQLLEDALIIRHKNEQKPIKETK